MVNEKIYKITNEKDDNNLETILVRINKENGIYAEIKQDITTKENKEIKSKKYYKAMRNSDVNMLPNSKLFEEFDKIELPKQRKFSEDLSNKIIKWHLIIDGKEYLGDTKPKFYTRIEELIKVKEIYELCVNKN